MKYEKTLEYFFDKYLSGSISIKNITIHGHNAMNWAIVIKTKKYGYICFNLPLPVFYINKPIWKPLYLYFSPNGTPWASTFFMGKKHSKYDWALSKVRYVVFGHNFNTDKNIERLNQINDI